MCRLDCNHIRGYFDPPQKLVVSFEVFVRYIYAAFVIIKNELIFWRPIKITLLTSAGASPSIAKDTIKSASRCSVLMNATRSICLGEIYLFPALAERAAKNTTRSLLKPASPKPRHPSDGTLRCRILDRRLQAEARGRDGCDDENFSELEREGPPVEPS
jgi:hypothetical protein